MRLFAPINVEDDVDLLSKKLFGKLVINQHESNLID